MTFLELVQKLGQESGTVADFSNPTTVSGVTGREAHLVGWVQDAWRDIQLARERWGWMVGEFETTLTIGTSRYAASDLGITRFDDWMFDPHDWRDSGLTLYEDKADEGALRFFNYHEFRQFRLRGSTEALEGKPTDFTVAPDRDLILWKVPDKAYTLRGLYYKAPQELSADSDEPELPERFHDLIWMKALEKLALNDEAVNQYEAFRSRTRRRMSELEHDQLPRLRMAPALA